MATDIKTPHSYGRWHTYVIGILLSVLSVFPMQTLAQETPTDSTNTAQTDSTEIKGKRKNIFVKAYDFLLWYLDTYSYDTTYISPSKFYYTLMMQHSADFASYTIRSTRGETPQKLRFAPDHSYHLGAYFGWHGLFLGLSVNMSELFDNRKGSDKKSEYLINLYGQKIGGDLFYRRTGNDFKIRSTSGFYHDDEKYNFRGFDFEGIAVKSLGFNVYYVFNNEHFSYPAAYAQTTVQKVSRGTLVAGVSWSRHSLDFDHTRLPLEIQTTLSDDLKFRHVKYTDFNINFGYAFNWVFAKNWLLAVALTPAVAYKASDIKVEKPDYNGFTDKFNLDFITRAGLVYNNNKFFAGISSVSHIYQYNQKNFALTDNFGVLHVYAGFNFGRRK